MGRGVARVSHVTDEHLSAATPQDECGAKTGRPRADNDDVKVNARRFS